MSTRSRAAPWFLERPEFYSGMLCWQGEPLIRQWSWNAITWFDYRGRVLAIGEYSLDQFDNIKRELRAMGAAGFSAAYVGSIDWASR